MVRSTEARSTRVNLIMERIAMNWMRVSGASAGRFVSRETYSKPSSSIGAKLRMKNFKRLGRIKLLTVDELSPRARRIRAQHDVRRIPR